MKVICPTINAREREDPYAAALLEGVVDAFRNHRGRWLWVPVLAATTTKNTLLTQVE
jgi:hypothetical protein